MEDARRAGKANAEKNPCAALGLSWRLGFRNPGEQFGFSWPDNSASVRIALLALQCRQGRSILAKMVLMSSPISGTGGLAAWQFSGSTTDWFDRHSVRGLQVMLRRPGFGRPP